MEGTPTTWWGKLDREPGTREVRAWHPLLHHCADVAACAAALLDLPLWRSRLAALAGLSELSAVQCQRLCVFAALHDSGKLNLGFQAKADLGAVHTAGHVSEVVALVGSELQSRFVAAIGLGAMEAWGAEDEAARLLLAAIAHHGRPCRVDGTAAPTHLHWQARGGRDPFAGMAVLADHVRAWFPEAWSSDVAPFPQSPALEHAFAGLVMLADWFGSDRRWFDFSESFDETSPQERFRWSLSTARSALCGTGLDVSAGRAALAGIDPFAAVTQHPPRAAQRALLDLPAEPGGSVTVLEAETGSGKTEAALARCVPSAALHVRDFPWSRHGRRTRTPWPPLRGRMTGTRPWRTTGWASGALLPR